MSSRSGGKKPPDPGKKDTNQFVKSSTIGTKRTRLGDGDTGSYFAKEKRLEDLSNGPQFLVMARNEKVNSELTLKNVSCFAIDKTIKGIAGDMKSIQRLSNGTLLIQTKTRSQATKLMNLDNICNSIKVKVHEHPTLNLNKGIISCHDFTFITDDEVREGLQNQSVIDAKIIKKRVIDSEGKPKFINTAYAIATFKLSSLPERINIVFYSSRVKPHIPDPIRCYNCQKFGHSAKGCGNKICGNCGENCHTIDKEKCTKLPKCINCFEQHPAWIRKCPIFAEEKKVQEIRILQKISYKDAKREYIKCNPFTKLLIKNRTQSTYAEIAATNRNNITEQTKTVTNQINTNAVQSNVHNEQNVISSSADTNKLYDINMTEMSNTEGQTKSPKENNILETNIQTPNLISVQSRDMGSFKTA